MHTYVLCLQSDVDDLVDARVFKSFSQHEMHSEVIEIMSVLHGQVMDENFDYLNAALQAERWCRLTWVFDGLTSRLKSASIQPASSC